MAIRSAEASRNATCSFADRVADLSITFYRSMCPREILDSFNQTVLATIIVQRNNSSIDPADDNKTMLKVVSMGVGTKVVASEDIMSHKTENGAKGDCIVRDNHAEVLARRGFLRYIYNQIQLRLDTSGLINEDDCIFSPPTTAFRSRLCLKPDVHFHLYTSSQPCGNASIKRWAKVKPLRYREELSTDFSPLDPHERIQITPESRQEGQVALLVKRNGRSNAMLSTSSETTNISTPEEKTVLNPPMNVASTHIPAGTALPRSQEGNVMTCSDKIALWNAVGLQGALLTAFIEPVYLRTITVGRKFSQVHCQRALCCRLQDFQYPQLCTSTGKKSNKKRKQSKLVPQLDEQTCSAEALDGLASPTQATGAVISVPEGAAAASALPPVESNRKVLFSIHHPAMLGTQVKLDEGTIATGPVSGGITSGNNGDGIGNESDKIAVQKDNSSYKVGAQFTEPRCITSYATCAAIEQCSANLSAPSHVLEVLNGRTGLLVNADGSSKALNNVSTVSSCSLRAVFKETYSVFYAGEEPAVMMESYCMLKRRVALDYAAAKDSLFADPLTFTEWVRKSK